MHNADFQNHLLDSIEDGRLLLVETERLVHQLRFRHRIRRREGGKAGWETPGVTTFNRWVERLWESLWPSAWPASGFRRWRLLSESVESLPPPEPLSIDAPLVLALDESFGECLRYGVDPGGGQHANKLVEWRRAVWRLFGGELKRKGFFHPAALPERLASELAAHPDLVREKVAICGFEFAGYWEKRLLQMLSERPDSIAISLPRGGTAPEAVVFTDPEQEIAAIIEDLVSASARWPLHELALVLFDSQVYSPIVAKYFEDLFGPPIEGEKAGYNLPPDSPLTRQPLFQAAFLPLDFSISGQARVHFLALLRSPYYGLLAPRSRMLCQWEWVWREKGIEKGLQRLMGVLDDSALDLLPERGEPLVGGFAPFLEDVSRAASRWIEDLRRFWSSLEFPVLANERDQIAWRSLQGIVDAFASEFADVPLRRSEFVGWIRSAAEKSWVERRGYEDAGVQIVSGLEARGLAFRKVFAPGLVAGVLPQPARSLPFLSPDERKRVQGGSAESQFEFARSLLDHLHAAAPEVVLSRPLMNREGEPCLPSPFWNSTREERRSPVVPWRHDLPALQRAEWVVQGIEGMSDRGSVCGGEGASRNEILPDGGAACRGGSGRSADEEVVDAFYCVHSLDFPSEVTVSELETILLCPSKFLFRNVLGLDVLPEMVRGAAPSERGQVVHEIAAAFGRKILREPRLAEQPFGRLLDELRNAIARVLADRAAIPFWGVEKRRLSGIGDEDAGLLGKWLELECGRFADGWRWVAVEQPFAGLEVGGCPISLRGRLDRLDAHPDAGSICWDYKTGRIPGAGELRDELRSPQLPAYVRAVENGLVDESPQTSMPVGAGYIDLGSAGRLRHMMSFPPAGPSDKFFERWENEVSNVLNDLAAGRLPPRWLAKEAGCDDPCPYRCLCGFALAAG